MDYRFAVRQILAYGLKGDFVDASSPGHHVLSPELGVPEQRLHLLSGQLAHVCARYKPAEGIAMLRLDTKGLLPAGSVLRRHFPAIVKGGCLVVEKYKYQPGCREAVNDYLVGPYAVLPKTEIDGDLVVWVV